MSISILGVVTAVAAAAGNIVVNFPATWGLAQNDVVYVSVASTSTADQDVTATGSFTELVDLYGNSTTDVNMALYRKVMGAVPDTSVTLDAAGTTANHVAIAIAMRGVDATTPEDAASTTATNNASGTPNNPAITTVTNEAIVMAWAASSEADAIQAGPANYHNLTQVSSTNITLVLTYRKKDAAGAEDPATYAGIVGTTADSWCAVTAAARPAVSGPAQQLPAKMAAYAMRRAA